MGVMKIQTSAGEIELTEKAFALNLEIFEVKEHIARLAKRCALKADSIDEVEMIADAIAENIRHLRDLERELDAENAE